jgi:hypothetical protein
MADRVLSGHHFYSPPLFLSGFIFRQFYDVPFARESSKKLPIKKFMLANRTCIFMDQFY